MKTILIPTDLSSVTDNAIKYAVGLNKKLKSKILFLHAYHIPMPVTSVPFYIDDKEIKKTTLESLSKIKKGYMKEYPNMNFEIEAPQGLATEEIINESKKRDCSLIIMAASGASPLRKALIGSNASTVLEKATCPVIIVPEKVKFKDIKKIVFATNYAEHDFENVAKIVDFARLYKAEVILLHISTGDSDKTSDFNSIEQFKEIVKKESAYDNISFKLLEGDGNDSAQRRRGPQRRTRTRD